MILRTVLLEIMPKSHNAEKKRRSRARKPPSYHAREREASRRRMAIYRAKDRAEKRALQLKCILDERNRSAIEARGAGMRRHLLREWFREQNLEVDPTVISGEKALRIYMSKVELFKIELLVNEFEISLMEDGEDEGDDSDHADGDDSVGSGKKEISNHKVDRLAKKDSMNVFEDIPESKVGPAHPQVFLGSTEQVGADPSVPSYRELGHDIIGSGSHPTGAAELEGDILRDLAADGIGEWEKRCFIRRIQKGGQIAAATICSP